MEFRTPLSLSRQTMSIEFNKRLIARLHESGFVFKGIGYGSIRAESLWCEAGLETLDLLKADMRFLSWP